MDELTWLIYGMPTAALIIGYALGWYYGSEAEYNYWQRSFGKQYRDNYEEEQRIYEEVNRDENN